MGAEGQQPQGDSHEEISRRSGPDRQLRFACAGSRHLLTKKCSVVAKTPPTPTEMFSMMGQYGSEQEAMTAMHKMAECKG